jgi:glycoprotein-N-acetylgalactosamine 3-beta-galactosyltransferase
MRHLLSPLNASTPLYLGFKFKAQGGYMSGGSGYILTKEAITRFVEIGLNFKHSEFGNNYATNNISSQQLCEKGHQGDEDVRLGKYVRLYVVNIK